MLRLSSGCRGTGIYHVDRQERKHQGKGNVLLVPQSSRPGETDGTMQRRARLGGLLKYYEREAA